MRFILGVCMVAVLFPCIVFAQTSAAQAGIIPGSPLYLFDRLSESIVELFTFTSAARARLQLSFAAERIAEIETMLVARGVSAGGISVAEKALAKHLAKSTDIVARAREEKNDALAQTISADIQQRRDALVRVFNYHKYTLEQKEAGLYNEAESARTNDEHEEAVGKIERLQKEKELTNAYIHVYELEWEDADADSLFGKDSAVQEGEKERLDQSIKGIEEEIKRTEEFLQKKKSE